MEPRRRFSLQLLIKRLLIALAGLAAGSVALINLPSPWGRALWGLSLFATAPIVLLDKATAMRMRWQLGLAAAGVGLGAFLYETNGFSPTEAGVMVAYFCALWLWTFLQARATRASVSR